MLPRPGSANGKQPEARGRRDAVACVRHLPRRPVAEPDSECRAALVALVRAGAALPLEAAWPDRWRDAAKQRARIMEFEGGRPRAAAKVEAERLVRVEHTRAFVDRSAFAVTPTAVAVAPRAPGNGPHRRP